MLQKRTILIIVISLIAIAYIIYLICVMSSSSSNLSHTAILQLQSTTSFSDLSTFFNNNLRTTITVSDKNQEVDLFFSSTDFSFFITQQDIFFNNNENSKINKFSNNFYNYEISSSIKIKSERTQTYFTNYKFGRKAEESFALCSENNCDKNSIKMNNFNFMLVEDPFEKVSGGIGLSPHEFVGDGAINLFNELYRKNYIKNNVWYIEYDENGDKKLIIGKFPNEVNKKYKFNNFDFFKIDNKGSAWQLQMIKISIGENDNNNDEDNNDNIIKYRNIEFKHEFSLIYGPPDYYKKIKNIFFNKYLNNKCVENTFTYQLIDYLYITCDEDISLKDFPPLIMDINKNIGFELTYDDLFMKNNGKILFLFFSNKIEKYFNEKWYMGEPFLKKYMTVYNQKELKIGFYGLNKKSKGNYRVAGILGSIFLFISIAIIIYLCLFLFRKYRNRKIRRAALEMKIEEISSKFISNKNENK